MSDQLWTYGSLVWGGGGGGDDKDVKFESGKALHGRVVHVEACNDGVYYRGS